MFGSKDRHDDATTQDRNGVTDRPYGTSTDADVTSRMSGTSGRHAADRDQDGVPDRDERGSSAVGHGSDHDGGRDGDERRTTGTATAAGTASAAGTGATPTERYEERRVVKPAKTSAAAAFALVFGVAALFAALTAILAPAAVLFGLIGLVLGVVGMKMGKRVGITGRGVAIGGLVTALLGLLLGLAVIAGAAVFVNDEQNLDRLQGWVDDARSSIPSGNEVVEEIPGN